MPSWCWISLRWRWNVRIGPMYLRDGCHAGVGDWQRGWVVELYPGSSSMYNTRYLTGLISCV